MAKTLVLVRHGKAQSRGLGLVDFERELTGAGKRALKEWLPKSARLMEQEGAAAFELWASPAARTMQTAELVAKAWGKRLSGFPERPQPVDELWNGNMQALLAAFDASPTDAVVFCGHNPYMEELCYELSGSSIRFATGAVAALRMQEGTFPRARLLWFVQGPISQDWKR